MLRKAFRPSAVHTSVAAILGTAGLHAYSLPAVAAEEEGEAQETIQEVQVTGSRIQRQDYQANSPVVTVDTELFSSTSTVGIETVLNQLPQFVPAATEFSSDTLQATATQTPGASIVNLRGLGSFRTLTLIDGRRATPLNATLAVDTNTIPSSAVERVEIISGGASAVYGADAVAGVVNFILKDDYQGIDLTTRYGITEEGDGEQLQISGLIGTSFADGRGNVMLGAEYADRSQAYNVDRRWIRRRLDDPYVAGTEPLFAETYVDFATVAPSQRPTQAAINAIFTDLAPCTLPNGTGNPCPTPGPNNKYFVNRTADGTGTLFTGAVGFLGSNGHAGSYRYDGPFEDPAYPGLAYRKRTADGLLQENDLSALTTVPLERFSMFGKAEYEVAEDTSFYLRGGYAHTATATATAYSPAVNNWTATIPVGFEGTVWADSLNPDGTTKAAYRAGGAYGLNCPATGGCTESQAFPLPPELEALLRSRTGAARDADIRIQRVMDYLPERQTHNRSAMVELAAGLEGRLANNWSWEASVSYGTTETVTVYEGFADLAQYIAVVTSPNFGVNFQRNGISPTSSGRGSCTTGLPLFRSFEISRDCIDTISADMQATGQIEQTAVDLNLTGGLLDLPAGRLQFAVGTDYRKWDYQYFNDHLNSDSTFISQAIGLFAQGNTSASLDTKEVYGELLIPIVEDLPLIEEFNLEVGGRYSDYNTSGGVSTYKVLGDWAITPWARLRGGYNRATRAPHIAEFFLGRAQTIAVLFDPCSRNDQALDYSANPRNPNAAQTEALCRSLMSAGAADAYYGLPVNQQPANTVLTTAYRRGNPNVDPETADTYTVGLVLDSRLDNPWVSGLSGTIDYYSIEIDDIIALQSGDEVWRQCVVSNDPNGEACSLTFRDPFDGRLTLVDLTYTNRGTLKFEGVDVAVNWRARLADLGLESVPGVLSFNTQITIPTTRETQDGPTAPVREWKDTLGCDLGVVCSAYEYQAFTTFNYATGPLALSLRWNHYPTIESATYATNPETRERGVFESYDVFSLTGSYSLTDTVQIRAGIDNVFDAEPPLAGGSYAADGGFVNETNPPNLPTPAAPSEDARYDQLGRRYFLGVNVAF